MSPATGRLWARRIATVIVLPTLSIGLVVALFELGLRIAGHRPIYEVYSKPTIFWQHDDLLGWSHQPDASGVYVGPRPWPIEFEANVSINSMGFRGPEFPPAHHDDWRVLVVGDSMVASFEVEYEQSFVGILQRELRQRLGDGVHVFNGGVRGYGTDQTLLAFREHADTLDPDVVVLFHSGNDRVDNTTLHNMRKPFGKPAFALSEDGDLSLVGSPVPAYPRCSEVQLSQSFQVVRADSAADRLACHAQMALFDHSALFSLVAIALRSDAALLRGLYQLANPVAKNRAQLAHESNNFAGSLTTALVLELLEEARRRDAAFVLTGFPDHLAQIDIARIRERGAEIVPLHAIANAPHTEVRWKHDSHLNPEGHRRLSRALLPYVEPHERQGSARTAFP